MTTNGQVSRPSWNISTSWRRVSRADRSSDRADRTSFSLEAITSTPMDYHCSAIWWWWWVVASYYSLKLLKY